MKTFWNNNLEIIIGVLLISAVILSMLMPSSRNDTESFFDDLENRGYRSWNLKQIEPMMEWGIQELNIENARMRWIISDNDDYNGRMARMGEDYYVIIISFDRILEDVSDSRRWVMKTAETIFHELVHVQQYELGILSKNDDGVVKWNDEEYHLTIPWEQRPWELQAIGRSGDMVEKYIREHFPDAEDKCYLYCEKYSEWYKERTS